MMEVLVSLIVLSFGSLGVAGLQATSKRANHEAKQQLTATYLANDFLEKMRNNPSALAVYTSASIGGATLSSEPTPTCTAAQPCNAAQLAAHDRWLWEQALDGVSVKQGTANAGGLVQPKACISRNGGQVQVVIAWYGTTKFSDTGTASGGVSTCGSAGEHRRQVVINSFIS
jgi:type IV pilus assembly protein PilV